MESMPGQELFLSHSQAIAFASFHPYVSMLVKFFPQKDWMYNKGKAQARM